MTGSTMTLAGGVLTMTGSSGLNSTTAPLIYFYTSDAPNYPTFFIQPYQHDSTNLAFDQYFDYNSTNWKASHTSASYVINKTGGNLLFKYSSATGAGTSISQAIVFELNGLQVQVPQSTDSSSTTTGAMTVSGGVGIAKNLYVGSSLYLPTSGGTPSALNYYEENTGITLTLSGLWSGNLSATTHLIKVGNIITANIRSTTSTTNTTGTYFNGTGLPSIYYPPATIYNPITLINNISAVIGTISISTSGAMTFTLASGTFPSGTTSGIGGSIVTWITI